MDSILFNTRSRLVFSKGGRLEGSVESGATSDEYYDADFKLSQAKTYKLFLIMKEYFGE